MYLIQFAHTGEGHTEEELQSDDHVEAVTAQNQTSSTATQATTQQSPKTSDSMLLPLIFVGAVVAIVVLGVVIALKNRKPTISD